MPVLDVSFLTRDIPGCGGRVRVTPADFQVEEIPAYQPTGDGEHLFVWIRKESLSTPQAVNLLARGLRLKEREVSYAGLKDTQAITLQQLCVPARAEPLLLGFDHPRLKVLAAKRNPRKLRTGHLSGNRFKLRLRDVQDVASALAVLATLRRVGLPNYFGEQRFGRELANARAGRELLVGREPLVGAGEGGGEEPHPAPDRFRRKLFLSAFQSALFNRALGARITLGTFSRALPGDVLKKHETGGEFVCEAPETDQPRVDAFEVSPAGPLFGPSMLGSRGEVGAFEQRLLDEERIDASVFERGRGETRGARRFYRVPVADLTAEPEGADLLLSFSLPAGSYATVLLRELLKQ